MKTPMTGWMTIPPSPCLSQYGAHPELAVSMSYDMPWGFGVPFCETAPCYIM